MLLDGVSGLRRDQLLLQTACSLYLGCSMVTGAPRCLAADQRCLASTACALPLPHRPRPALPPRQGAARRSAATCSSAHAQGAWSCRRRFATLVAHAQRGGGDRLGEPGEAESVEPEVLPPGEPGPLPTVSEGIEAAPAPTLASTGGRRAEAWAPASWRAGGRGAPWTALLGVGGASLAALAGAPAPAPPDPAGASVTRCCVRYWQQLAPAARPCPAAAWQRLAEEAALRRLAAERAWSAGQDCAFATRARIVAARPLASSGMFCDDV